MENVGKKPGKSVGKLTVKSKWIILFSVFGVAIVGLVIAIVVVLANRNNSQEVTNSVSQQYDEALSIYFDDNEAIAGEIVAQDLQGEALLNAIKAKIEAAENEMARAMLESDYYYMMIAVYGEEANKDEIVNGLIKVDDILKTGKSAESVANAGIFYHDYDLYEKYIKIAKERDPEIKSIDDTLEGEEE